MYIPNHFAQHDHAELFKLIDSYPLATLITLAEQSINANHIPLHHCADGSELGKLHGHIAKANPLWPNHDPQQEILAIFQAVDHYITPMWYASKAETGKVVPTWNYAVVHAYGTMQIIHDRAWLQQQLDTLTNHNEAQFAHPWAVTDAPSDYIDKLLNGIVGIEISITRLEGKWKVSQNQPTANQHSLIAGLKATGNQTSHAMAELIGQTSSGD